MRIVGVALAVATVFFALCAHIAACAAYLVARELTKLPPQGPAYQYARIVSAPLRWLLDK